MTWQTARTTISSNMSERTIAAISTPPGKGGVAVIRISGDEAIKVASAVFSPKKPVDPKSRPRYQIYGDIMLSGERIDDGLLCYFPAPNSYTGEDMVEICCHGGVLVTESVLKSCFIEGAYPAEAGEFTKRAFLGGKLSLTEAEAVSAVLEAKSEAQLKLAASPSRQRLCSAISDVTSRISALLSSIYARIDYPDEDLGELSVHEIEKSITDILHGVDSLISSYKTGRAVNEGISAVICGKPNVGKSTLYNLLLRDDAAIVTDIPGTTTDVLERTVSVGKVLLRLFDTAGIRNEASGAVERIGIERSKERIASSELIIILIDGAAGICEEDMEILKLAASLDSSKLLIVTKSELSSDKTIADTKKTLCEMGFGKPVVISAKEDPERAVSIITEKIEGMFTDGSLSIGNDAIVFSARQNASLVKAKRHLEEARTAYLRGIAEDAASSELELALGAISELDGRAVSEMIVSDIFSKFCVGK